MPVSEPAQQAVPFVVAVLVFEGVELLDFAGPADVFVVAGEGKHFRVVTVAPSRAPLRTMGGIELVPAHSFDDAPQPDVVVVPGGAMSNAGPAAVEWIRRVAPGARVTMSVCMGAFLLAKAGLLDGIEATTHHWGVENLRRAAPACRVTSGVRYVDSGRVLTTAGVTAGIDGALRVVENLCGADAARWTAEEWMEHRAR